MLPPRKPRSTTNSNHRYHKWKNRIKNLVLNSANQLWVSDIILTYRYAVVMFVTYI